MKRSPPPISAFASMSRHTTSTSASVSTERLLQRSPSSVRGLWIPGVSSRTICDAAVVRTPRIWVRVVCGRFETIETFEPTSRFTSVDFPTLGRPTRLTNPERSSGHDVRASVRSGAPRRPSSSPSSSGSSHRHDRDRRDAAALDPLGAELEPLEPHRLARLGHVAEQVEHEPADGVPLGVGQLDAEHLVHLVDRRPAGRADAAAVERLDAGLLDVVLVDDLADDLLEQVLERDEPGGAAVLVDDDRHVELLRAHLAQQLGDPLRLGDEHRVAHRDAHRSAPPPARARWTRSFRYTMPMMLSVSSS